MSEMNSNVLSLKGVRITTLPDGFKVNGGLDLRGSFIIKLPKNLRVLGNLILNEHIEEIPEDIMIGGNLDMSESNISKLPSYFAVCGDIIGSKYNLSKPSFAPNTIYKNIVCCDNGTLVLYEKYHLHKREYNNGKKDEHTLNKYGNIDWDLLAKKLSNCNEVNLDYELLANLEESISLVDDVKLSYVEKEQFINKLPARDMNKIIQSLIIYKNLVAIYLNHM